MTAVHIVHSQCVMQLIVSGQTLYSNAAVLAVLAVSIDVSTVSATTYALAPPMYIMSHVNGLSLSTMYCSLQQDSTK
jgi:hypothetical protein